MVAWDGLVPKGSDPGSCGLCGDQPGGEGLTLRPVGFTLALVGAYALVLYGPVVLRARRAPSRRAVRCWAPAVAGGAGAAAGRVAAHLRAERPRPPGRRRLAVEGGRSLPELAGSSLVFFVLVPAGLLALCLLVRRAGVESLPAVAFRVFLLAALPVRLVYQKYFDPMVLVTLALLARPPDLRRRATTPGAGGASAWPSWPTR